MLFKRCILLVGASLVLWADGTKTSEDIALLSSLAEDLIGIERNADAVKYNIDYKPYIISVLQHHELAGLGVKDLREALKLVPGVDITVGPIGEKYPVFRGSSPFSMGQVQLYIDDVAVNDAFASSYNAYLDLPVELIERIEVVRGPGSLLNHAHAYGGSINVITRASTALNRHDSLILFGGAGDDDHLRAGIIAKECVGGWDLSADTFYQRHNDRRTEGPDIFGDIREGNFDNENRAFGFHAHYGNWQIDLFALSQDLGPGYGQMYSLSEDLSDYLKNDSYTMRALHRTPLPFDTDLTLEASLMQEDKKLQNKTIPDGQSFDITPSDGIDNPVLFPDGRYMFVDYGERRLSLRAEIGSRAFDHHELIAGITYTRHDVTDNRAAIGKPDGSYIHTDLVSTEGRDTSTLYVEDRYSPTAFTSFAIGLRYEHSSDHAVQKAPRFSVVHQLTPDNIVKAMYTRSYRLPTWREAYFFSALDNAQVVTTETVDAYEVSYIHKLRREDSFHFNLFYLDNKDQTDIDPVTKLATRTYDSHIPGFELELALSPSLSDTLKVTYSYANGSVDGGGSIHNATRHMATLTNMYDITDALATGTIVKYVHKKERVEGDVRAPINAYTVWDQSLGYSDRRHGYTVSLSIKNVLDTEYYMPSVVHTYENDFLQPGRSFWLTFEKRWSP